MFSTEKVYSQNFLEDILGKYFQKVVRILNVKVTTDVTSAGDYVGSLKRIKVTYLFENENGERSISLISKSFPDDEHRAKLINDLKLFDIELRMYNEVMPLLSKLDYQEKMSPKAYCCVSKPSPILLLEDLCELRYKVTKKRDGLDLEHCLLVVDKLAYLHAASFAFSEKGWISLEGFNRSTFQKSSICEQIVTLAYNEIVKVCRRISDLNKYVQKLELAKEYIVDKIFSVDNAKANYKVLNHGDCWFPNIMFYYDQHGDVKDLAFIDFQVSCYTTPCYDLYYFIASSANLQSKHNVDAIINHYFENFTQKLRKFNTTTMPTRKEFDEDFLLFSYCGFGASLLALSFTRGYNFRGGSIQKFLEDDSAGGFRHYCFRNEDYLKELFYYLPFYDSLGVFDIKCT